MPLGSIPKTKNQKPKNPNPVILSVAYPENSVSHFRKSGTSCLDLASQDGWPRTPLSGEVEQSW